MEDEKREVRCPFCGHVMCWMSDAMSEECGYSVEGKVVTSYTCTNCGSTGEFVENMDEDENDD